MAWTRYDFQRAIRKDRENRGGERLRAIRRDFDTYRKTDPPRRRARPL